MRQPLVRSVARSVGRNISSSITRELLSSYWNPPFKSDLLAGGDGTIITIGSDKYLKDKVSGKNLLITGYDFDSTIDKGFPYKSAATISAPAGDAAFIAADLNSFWYTAGTPNQIPVISLFQDIDYEHKTFFKHAAQVLDGNGVEIYEPRVIEWAVYSTAKAGADIVTAQTYFGATAESATAKWLDVVNGDDLNSGTKALPYKTLAVANTNATNEIYAETGGDDIGAVTKVLSKNLQGISSHKIIGTAAFALTFNTAGLYCRGIEVKDMAAGIYLTGAGILIDKCFLNGMTSSGIRIPLDATIKNCLFNSSSYQAWVDGVDLDVIFEDNLFSGNSYAIRNIKEGCDISFKNNRLISNNYAIYGVAHIMGNVISMGNKGTSKVFMSFNSAESIIAKSDRLTLTTSYLTSLTQGDEGTYDFQDLILSVLAASNSNAITINGKNTVLKNSIIEHNGGGGQLYLYSDSNIIDCSVSENVFITKGTSGFHVQIGTSSLLIENKISGYFKNNRIFGNGLYNETPATNHGLSIWANNNIEIANNYIDGWGLAMVLKGSGTDYANNLVHHNIIKHGSIVVKGVLNVKLINNTFFNEEAFPNIDSVVFDGGIIHSEGTVLKNNILINLNPLYPNIRTTDNNETFVSDYNIFYATSGYVYNELTLAEWQALSGNDLHSVFLTEAQYLALFNDPNNGDFSLKAGSVAIGAGETLDAAYDDGLDVSTNWGSETQLPVVVTKQQGAAWDIGAYVH